MKDEYTAGVPAPVVGTTGGMDVDTEAGTIQHHPPPQYTIPTQPGTCQIIVLFTLI